MYDNRSDMCGCNKPVKGIQDVEEGLCAIQKGLKCLKAALDALRCGDLCEAEKNLVAGISKIEKGLCMLEKGLKDLRNVLSCEDLAAARDGVCDIKKGLKDACDALKNLRCGRECEAEKDLVCAIQAIEDGLCKVLAALKCVLD